MNIFTRKKKLLQANLFLIRKLKEETACNKDEEEWLRGRYERLMKEVLSLRKVEESLKDTRKQLEEAKKEPYKVILVDERH